MNRNRRAAIPIFSNSRRGLSSYLGGLGWRESICGLVFLAEAGMKDFYEKAAEDAHGLTRLKGIA